MITNAVIQSFLLCQYKAYLKFHQQSGNPSEYEQLEQELSKLHKASFYQELQSKCNEEQILHEVSFKQKTQFTQPTYVLKQCFQSDEHVITVDIIEIVPHKEFPQQCSYLPIEIIPKGKVSKYEKLTLAIKCLILSQSHHVSFEAAKIIYGRQLKATKILLTTYTEEARKLLRDLKKIVKNEKEPRFYRNAHCKICEFQEVCKTELIKKDDLSLLGRISQKEVLKKNNRGIFTILQLSYTFRPRKKRKKSKIPQHFEWVLKALALREKRTYVRKPPNFPNTKDEIYLDFEGLPDENFVYLIGLLIQSGTTEKRLSFWAHSEREEETIFQQLFQNLSSLNDFTIYHYGNYEHQALKKINKKYNEIYTNEIQHIFDNSVNILSFFTSTIYPPTYTNELKDIAHFLGFRWSAANASGIQSLVWRKKWELSGKSSYKTMLIQYNLEDCQALQLTKRWLNHIDEQLSHENEQHFANVDDIKVQSTYKFEYTDYLIPEFDEINKFAYFNYQRDKIYIKTNPQLKKLVKRKQQQLKRMNKPNKIVDVPFPEACPYCESPITLPSIRRGTKTCMDLKFTSDGIKKWIVLFRGTQFWCRICKRHFTPSDIKNLPRFGRNLIIWSLNQEMAHKVLQYKVVDMLVENFHIKIADGTIYKFKVRLAKEYEETAREIKQHLLNGSLINTDETQASILGVKKYVWVFANIDSVYYLFRETRETDFLAEWLQGFNGVLVSDFYTGYDSLPYAQQKCLIHLIRDFNDDLFKYQLDEEYKEIVIHFGKLLTTIMETVNIYGLKKRHLQKHQKDVDQFYHRIIDKDYESELAISYQKRLKKYQEKLFTFLHYGGIPWNNNNAETAIKYFATYRRNVRGNSTEQSIQYALQLLSIQQTCKYRGINFLEFLKSGEKSTEAYSKKV